MTPADYKAERQRRGTLKGVAALLGIHWTTLARREAGVIELTTEMALAMRSLPLRKPKRFRKGTNARRGAKPLPAKKSRARTTVAMVPQVPSIVEATHPTYHPNSHTA
jgi:hypothetical protein